MKYILYFLSLFFTSQFLYCQKNIQRLPNTFNIQMDQDVFHPLNEDRNYTMGLKFELELNCLDSNFVYNGLRSLNNILSFNRSEEYLLNSISLGYGAFTPDSLGTVTIIEGDRPYSGVLVITGGVKKVNVKNVGENRFKNPKRRFSYTYSQASIGVLGLNLGRTLQSAIHSVGNPNYADTIIYSNPVKPYGWDNQISNGGGLVGLLTHGNRILLTRKHLNFLINRENGLLDWQDKREKLRFFDKFTEASTGYEFMIGYYNNIQLNSQIRIGGIDPTNWYFSSSTNGIFNKGVKDKIFIDEYKKELKPESKDCEIYVFADFAVNYMVYNSLLRGQLIDFLKFNSTTKYTLGRDEVENLFFEMKFGINLRLLGLNFSYIPVSLRTSEINTTEYFKRTHRWSEFSIKFNI